MTFDCSVAVIAGGLSFEREVSLRSGQRVAEALRERGYRVGELDADHRLVEALGSGEFDVAFLALHGRFGEDGTVASILELLGIPYTGSSFEASRLAFDKLAAKSVLRRAGLSVPSAIPLTEGALRELGVGSLLDRAMDDLGLPLVVKPNRGGSALGIRLVERPDQLPAALMAAFGYDDTVLLEHRVQGTELALSVVDGLPTLPPSRSTQRKAGTTSPPATPTAPPSSGSPRTSIQRLPASASKPPRTPTSPSAAATSPESTPSSTPPAPAKSSKSTPAPASPPPAWSPWPPTPPTSPSPT